MYFEDHRRSPTSRANDEFLRRMLGGEVVGRAGNGMPAFPSPDPAAHDVDCSGKQTHGDPGEGVRKERHCCEQTDAPSLAMVYAPRQPWEDLLDPFSALEEGSLFAELILPFQGDQKFNGMGVTTCR